MGCGMMQIQVCPSVAREGTLSDGADLAQQLAHGPARYRILGRNWGALVLKNTAPCHVAQEAPQTGGSFISATYYY